MQTGDPRQAVRVPLAGVFERFGSQNVYVVEDGIATRRPIVLGEIRGGRAEVVKGLEPGEMVVSEGVARVVDGSAVKVVPDDSATASSGSPGDPRSP